MVGFGVQMGWSPYALYLPQAGLALRRDLVRCYKQAFDPASPLPKSKWEVDYGLSRKRGIPWPELH